MFWWIATSFFLDLLDDDNFQLTLLKEPVQGRYGLRLDSSLFDGMIYVDQTDRTAGILVGIPAKDGAKIS
jgi:hypothetical protein